MHWMLSPEVVPTSSCCAPLVEDILTSERFLTADTPMALLRQELIISPEKIADVITMCSLTIL